MIIEQEKYEPLKSTKTISGNIMIYRDDEDDWDSIVVDAKGAKQLIKVLQEFVDENQD